MKFALRTLQVIGWIAAGLVYLVWSVWAFGAVWYFNFLGDFRMGLAVIAALWLLVAPWLKPRRHFRLGVLGTLAAITVVWLAIRPSHDRDWVPEYGRMPKAEFIGENRLKITDIRDFHYRAETDFDVRYRTREYDLDQLESVDFIVVHWDNMEVIGHTMLSFGFAGGERLVFSVETRRDREDVYGSIPGLYKQFELIVVVGTERDVLGLRTNYRHEDVYLYPTTSDKAGVRKIFLHMIEQVNSLYRKPRFYNTLTHNCTTSLLPSIRQAVDLPLRNPTYLCNGFSDRLGYKLGWLRRFTPDETFSDLKMRSYANPLVDRLENPEPYSELLRRPLVLPERLDAFRAEMEQTSPEPFSVSIRRNEAGKIDALRYRYIAYPWEQAVADWSARLGEPVERSAEPPHVTRWNSERFRIEAQLTAEHPRRPEIVVSAW